MSPERAARGCRPGAVFAFRMLGMFMVLPGARHLRRGPGRREPGAHRSGDRRLRAHSGGVADSVRHHLRSHRPSPRHLCGIDRCLRSARAGGQSTSIWGVIAGRVLQGAGAISAAVMALLSDLTREQHRTKAMAMIGMTIGVSFAVAMVVGPHSDQCIRIVRSVPGDRRHGAGRHADHCLRRAQVAR